MSILKIVQLGHPILRQKTREVQEDEIQSDGFQTLLENMFLSLADSDRPGWASVGLAGPQVHESRRLFIIRMEPEKEEELETEAPSQVSLPEIRQVFINPVITKCSDETVEDWESCLSLPDILGRVKRHKNITVEALNREGEEFTLDANDFYARVIQHEIDHLDGVLFVDRMEDMETLTFTENLRQAS